MASHSAVHLQLHSPTGVTHCSRAFITHPAPSGPHSGIENEPESSIPNLVIVRSTILEVYVARCASPTEVRLELVTKQRLFGIVESLAVLRARAGRAGHDAILLAFRDAKLSVLQWEPATNDLAPSSLHYFEGDESLKAGRHAFPRPPLVLTDPRGRCAALIMLRHQLAILPATEAESEAAALGVFNEADIGAGAAVGNSYVDNLGKIGIKDVRDAVFLHGTSEPTLLVLHEGDPTWAGILSTKKDTCSISALSVNMTSKRHPRIWGAQGLPSDAYRVIAAPVGGVLVFTNSSVLYYTQGFQSGVVLHSAALPAKQPLPPLVFDPSREAPGETAAKYARAHVNDLAPQAAAAALSFCDASWAEWNLDCDAARLVWISQTIGLLGLKTGQLVLVELARSAGTWHVRVARAGAAPQPSCMAALTPSIVFIGSVAGDSLLVKCTLELKKDQKTAAIAIHSMTADGTGTPAGEAGQGAEDGAAAKRRRLESADADPVVEGGPGSETAAEAEDADDVDALLYGNVYVDAHGGIASGSKDGAADLRCSLRVLDSFMSIGPARSLAASGAALAGQSPPYLVVCCGVDKGGALAVLRRSVVPDIITEVPLPEVLGTWAIAASGQKTEQPVASYLLLSFPSYTKVLLAGDELQEASDDVEFAVDTSTIAAGVLCDGTRLVQAFPQGLRTLEGTHVSQEMWASELGGAPESTLIAVYIADPYVLLTLSDGTCQVVHAHAETGQLSVLGHVPMPEGQTITAACIFQDTCGWMKRQLHDCLADADADKEETLYFACACFSDSTMALWTLPNLSSQPIWRTVSLVEGSSTLNPLPENAPISPEEASRGACIVELRIESFGSVVESRPDLQGHASVAACAAPVLMALTFDNSLLVYKAFSVSSGQDGRGVASCLRFKRLALDIPPLLPPPLSVPTSATANASGGTPPTVLPRIHRFDGVGQQIPHSGLFVSGESPVWLIAGRGTLYCHPLHVTPGLAITGFTPFNNVNCPHGFITTCSGTRSSIQISNFPSRQRLDAPWPRQKVAIKSTPLSIALYPEASLFALVAARKGPYRPFLPEEEGGEPQASFSYALADSSAALQGSLAHHELCLMQPGSWSTLWRYALLPGEKALTVETVHLKDARTGATVPLIALGTGFSAGEDYPCSGRVLLFEIRKKGSGSGGSGVPEWDAEVVYAREFKGPVTRVASLEGHLLLATGNRLETLTLSSSTVVNDSGADADAGRAARMATTSYSAMRSAFYEGPMLVTSLTVVKSFVLIGDAQHSVQFVRYRDEGRQLTLLSKDFGRASVRAAQFFISGSSLHIVAADASGTFQTYTYTPTDPGSWKGQKLMLWGALHVGDGVGTMLRLRAPQPSAADTVVRQAALYGTDTGGLGVIEPLSVVEHLCTVTALKSLQKELVSGASHAAGLNPAAFRRRYAKVPRGMEGASQYGAPLSFSAQGILDGELLMEYGHLPRVAQHRLATNAGLEREKVLMVLSVLTKCSQLI